MPQNNPKNIKKIIFLIFGSVSAFLEGGSTALSSAGQSGATERLNEELAHRADEPESRKGASSAETAAFSTK